MKGLGAIIFLVVVILLLVAGIPQQILKELEPDHHSRQTYNPPPTYNPTDDSNSEPTSGGSSSSQAPANVILNSHTVMYNQGSGEMEFSWSLKNIGDKPATSVEVSIICKEDGDWGYDIAETIPIGTLQPGESESLYGSFEDDGDWDGTEDGYINWDGGENNWHYDH